ncbi:hypothetical protein G7Y31_00055 [Corynebacterium lizhenjunii]|uniref:Secreted protein n=1 Tax=Corynebacterium lizhenjunii TaxID=2709394 RepID=A0A7T0KFS8_9CORY|nr:hypothetical protein [Corynebacterium lizhenjunii]QPK79174.1 hypothetical protein G7Y31_00055 [Corynebacterium lizhenjunii]
MKLKNLAVAALTTALIAAAAPAASANETLINNNTGTGFEPGTNGVSFTGSSLTDVASITVPTLLGAGLIANRAGVMPQLPNPANFFGQGGSSNINAELERLGRDINNQIAAFTGIARG